MPYNTSNELKTRKTEAADKSIISAEANMLLEVFALQNHTFICIFDAIRSCYIFQTHNTFDYALSEENINHYLGFLHDQKKQNRIIDLEAKIIAQFTQEEKKEVRIFICGGYRVKTGQNRIKHLLQRIPLAYGPKAYPGIYLDNIRNVTHLISGDGYWIRIKTRDKVYSWFSDEEKLLRHDIISEREKEVIECWANGYNLSKIGNTLFISVNTVKNHLKACRNRLLARDNASLVQLCLLCDVISPIVYPQATGSAHF